MEKRRDNDTPVPDYYNKVTTPLLHMVQGNLDCILEVGCGAGAFALQYKTKYPDTRYLGIELNEDAAQYALSRNRLDDILIGDADFLDITDFVGPDAEIDCIIYGDVLEHMKDPWKVLKSHCIHLKKDGIVLACIPNTSHWSIIYNLLSGKWDYQDDGLLDRTHLRFFTLKTIHELFSGAGLTIFDIQSRLYNSDSTDSFINKLIPVLNHLNIQESHYQQNLRTVQYLVAARK